MTTRYPGEQVDRLGKRPATVRDSTPILSDAEVGVSFSRRSTHQSLWTLNVRADRRLRVAARSQTPWWGRHSCLPMASAPLRG